MNQKDVLAALTTAVQVVDKARAALTDLPDPAPYGCYGRAGLPKHVGIFWQDADTECPVCAAYKKGSADWQHCGKVLAERGNEIAEQEKEIDVLKEALSTAETTRDAWQEEAHDLRSQLPVKEKEIAALKDTVDKQKVGGARWHADHEKQVFALKAEVRRLTDRERWLAREVGYLKRGREWAEDGWHKAAAELAEFRRREAGFAAEKKGA